MSSSVAVAVARDSDKRRVGNAAARESAIVFLLAALLRIPFVSTLYFADGPAHLRAVQNGTFLIQPPGYWLFHHLAGLFPNPVLAISAMNVFFASLGVAVFHQVALRLMTLGRARAATAVYATVFYAWFSAEVHSTYASQLLFPVLVFYCLLRSGQSSSWLYAAAAAFAIGAGLRPSDGAFLLPMLLYFLLVSAGWRKGLGPALAALGGCLAWLIPTAIGYAQMGGIHKALAYTANVTTVVSVLHGVNNGWEANVLRLVLPLLTGLGLIIAGAFRAWDKTDVLLVVWIAPGLLFFCLSYVSDAPYLDYFTAACILLCARGVSSRTLLAATALNTVIFLFAAPMRTHAFPVKIFNHYVLKYTLAETRNHRTGNLSQDLQSEY